MFASFQGNDVDVTVGFGLGSGGAPGEPLLALPLSLPGSMRQRVPACMAAAALHSV